MRAAMTLVQRLAEEVFTMGTYSALERIIPHAEMNALMRPLRLSRRERAGLGAAPTSISQPAPSPYPSARG